MSAWGINNFENDVALDFVGEVIAGNVSLVKSFAEGFVANFHPEETSLDECFAFLALCELFAAIKKKPSEDIPSELTDWLERTLIQVDNEPLNICIKGLQLILKDSEAKEMYLDTEYYNAWEEIQKDLLKRLKSK